MLVGILNFDLTVDFPIGHSIIENIMFRGYLMMTSYMEMLVNLVLLDLLDFYVILGIDWLASYNPLVDCFGKRVMFHILD